VDPLGGAPIYLVMTAGLLPAERAHMARLVAINSFVLLVASVLVGAYVLDFFGVSIPAVQVAGGFIVCAIAWSLLTSPSTPAVSERSAATGPDVLSQRAFYPITMPLTVGPGSISVAMTLGANPPRGIRSLVTTAVAHVAGIFVVAVSIYLCYRYADRILRKLGTTGTNVLIRLTAFILFCIGVQIMWNGLRTLLMAVLHPLAA
jgi:multiple antibiotic resistance protein